MDDAVGIVPQRPGVDAGGDDFWSVVLVARADGNRGRRRGAVDVLLNVRLISAERADEDERGDGAIDDARDRLRASDRGIFGGVVRLALAVRGGGDSGDMRGHGADVLCRGARARGDGGAAGRGGKSRARVARHPIVLTTLDTADTTARAALQRDRGEDVCAKVARHRLRAHRGVVLGARRVGLRAVEYDQHVLQRLLSAR
mmetsp:Transcript_5898/g.23301  ORF Transcript_5898/g.23301 Transcript_5898/m.23301 type:complete len:201 (+) Transcript_5898:372-974(+)